MKTMKRVMALAIALVLCVSMMAIPANADIIVTGTQENVTYTAYRVFIAEGSGNTVAYTLNPAWEAAGIKDLSEFIENFTMEGDYVVPKDSYTEAQAAEFAKQLEALAELESIGANGTATTGASPYTVNFGFDADDYGYYLVTTSQGAKPILAEYTEGDLPVNEKNVLPTIDKTVQENSTAAWGVANDASYGETVNFKITIACEADAQNYVVTDTLADGFTMSDADPVVKYNDSNLDAANYTITKTGNTFEIAFKQTFLDTVEDGKKIEITYSAKVNSDKAANPADMGTPGNENTVTLEYGPDPANPVVKEDSTTTYVYQITGTKTDGTNNLSGVTFVVMDKAVSGKYLKYNDSTGAVTWVDTADAATKVTTGADGKFVFAGLDAGTYYLKETESPAGYVVPADPITITVTATINAIGTLTNLEATENANWATVGESVLADGAVVLNLTNSSTELPETGGMGTTLFYTAGTVMVLAAALVLFGKKRMTAEK